MSDYFRFRDQFAEAMDGRLYTIDYLDDLVFSGRAQVWFGDDSAMVTEIRTYPTGARVIHGLVAAGSLSEIVKDLIPRAEGWGRMIGCIGAIIESREGWGRVLRKDGWEPFQQSLWKEL